MAATSSPEPHLDDRARDELLGVARETVERGIRGEGRWRPDSDRYRDALRVERACFVTLHLDGRLRGCVGSLTPREPLVVETARSAHGAAFSDPRFPAVARDEAGRLHYHISVLSAAEPLCFGCESELLAQLRPGVDGLILREGTRTGTFLPQVWRMFESPAEFIEQLRLKAGLPAKHWSGTLAVSRYTTESFGDE